jgi:hypothetical protein
VSLALLLVHLEKDFPLHLQALTHALADYVLLVLVVVTAAARHHKPPEGFFLFSGKESGAKTNGENAGKQMKNSSFHNDWVGGW